MSELTSELAWTRDQLVFQSSQISSSQFSSSQISSSQISSSPRWARVELRAWAILCSPIENMWFFNLKKKEKKMEIWNEP
jgi:hypothetical protein